MKFNASPEGDGDTCVIVSYCFVLFLYSFCVVVGLCCINKNVFKKTKHSLTGVLGGIFSP